MSGYTTPRCQINVENANPVIFTSITNPNYFGMVNFCCWERGMENIQEKDQIVDIEGNIVTIYFPIFEHFWVETLVIQKPFTLKDLIQTIYQVGLNAGKWDIQNNPHHYLTDEITPEDFLGEYSVTSSPGKYDIYIQDDTVYIIQLQH